jgi:nicotinamidase-related amidase
MPVTALDPNTALIIVDLQKGIVGFETAHPAENVIRNSRRLADAFRERGLPVVLVNVDGGAPGRTERPRPSGTWPADFAELVPELRQQPSDIVVTKRTWGAFASSDLEQRLKSLGVTQVVVTGIATTAGVESTARQAYEAGFNVTLATDAMTDMSREAHDCSVANIFPRLGETGTTDDILSLLDR